MVNVIIYNKLNTYLWYIDERGESYINHTFWVCLKIRIKGVKLYIVISQRRATYINTKIHIIHTINYIQVQLNQSNILHSLPKFKINMFNISSH